MDWVKAAAYLALGTGLVLTLCLALALAVLDFRLFSAHPQDFPPGLPGLILALALASGSFLFLGWRLSRGRKVRLTTYQGTLGLVILSLVVLARHWVALFLTLVTFPGALVFAWAVDACLHVIRWQ